MIKIINLTEIDFQILDFIKKHNSVHIKDILLKFPDNKYSTKYKIELLSQQEKHSSGFYYLENTSYIKMNYEHYTNSLGETSLKELDTYYITEKGKVVLQEYKIKTIKLKKEKRNKLFLQIAPILISLLALSKSFEKEIIYIWKLLTQS